jgi:hypothetical protein
MQQASVPQPKGCGILFWGWRETAGKGGTLSAAFIIFP